ncbi:hypothetical protein CYMTET_55760 [Cymbomonas tetramitiformis]|uniref:SWIM-type domain-containing protein n=1 Tax=Cymbomonas tetramitiformis TaxID=36881 RepID=A0AAE0BCD5_9CHLO|nr:hypothetical protein CYMTET_55760 [Cymbomonas tetramitiformis]
MSEPFEFTSPGKQVAEVYEDISDAEDFGDNEPTAKTKQRRTHTEVPYVLTLEGATFEECLNKAKALFPDGYSKANSSNTSKKTGDVTSYYKCAFSYTHSCGFAFKVVMRCNGSDNGAVTYVFYQRGSHDHESFVGKTLSPEIRELLDEDIRRRLPPKRIFKNLNTVCPARGLQCPKYDQVRSYIHNNRKNILDVQSINTHGDYMAVCQSSNLLTIPSSDLTAADTLCMFDGCFLTTAGVFVAVDYYVANSQNTLPPIPFQAAETLEELRKWSKAGWNEDASVYEQILQVHFSSILACESAEFFVHNLETLLTSLGWSTYAKRFYKGKLNLRSLHTNYSAFVHDYTVAQKRKRWCVIYTTWGKLFALSKSLHRSRDDTYKTNWQGFPLECVGSSQLDKRFKLGLFSIKSHEDAFASEIVDFLAIHAIYHGFQKLWEPRYHTLDHSYAFYNANASLPGTITNVLGHLQLENTPATLDPSQIVQGTCWSHCKMKLNEKASHFTDANNVHGFTKGVLAIHEITIKAVRDEAFSLYMTAYEGTEEYICHWFRETWWGKWSGWVLGTMPNGTPATQNGPEGANRWVKEEVTLRKQLQLDDFHSSALKYMHEETIYDAEHPPPAAGVPQHHTWKGALLMVETNIMELSVKTMTLVGYEGEACYIVPSFKTFETLSGETLIAKQKQLAPQIATFCALIRDPEHPPALITNFKDFVRTYHSFVILRSLEENSVSQYVHFSCNCAVYAESLVCPCSLALSLFKGKCKAPLEKQLDLIGRLPQVGRPAKPASALKRQHPIGNVAAKLKRQASKRVREDQSVDCEARLSHLLLSATVGNSFNQ